MPKHLATLQLAGRKLRLPVEELDSLRQQIQNQMAERRDAEEKAFFDKASQHDMLRDGELEIDHSAVVSVSTDGGAYVQVWLWVEGDAANDGAEHGVTG